MIYRFAEGQKERGGAEWYKSWGWAKKKESDEFNLIFYCADLCGPWQIGPVFPHELALLSATPHRTSGSTWPGVVSLLACICLSSWPDGSNRSVQHRVTAQSACSVTAIKPSSSDLRSCVHRPKLTFGVYKFLQRSLYWLHPGSCRGHVCKKALWSSGFF